jgi:hypothetical protein
MRCTSASFSDFMPSNLVRSSALKSRLSVARPSTMAVMAVDNSLRRSFNLSESFN